MKRGLEAIALVSDMNLTVPRLDEKRIERLETSELIQPVITRLDEKRIEREC